MRYEYTDTFGGEANYCWVNRGTGKGVRDIKAKVGLTGIRCKREEWGETIVLKPQGHCAILFIDAEED